MFRKSIVVIAAFLAAAGVCINLSSFALAGTLEGNTVIYAFLFFGFLFLLKRAVGVVDRGARLYSLVAAVAFSGVEIVGRSLEKYNSLVLLYSSAGQAFRNCVEFLGLSILFYGCFALLFDRLRGKGSIAGPEEEGLPPGGKKKAAWLLWLIIFLAWMPYLAIYFPGSLSNDSIVQLGQALGASEMSNVQPVFHTLFIAACMKAGGVFGSNVAGVAVYSVLQMAAMSGIFAFTLGYMEKRGVHKYLRAAAFAFFAFFPINAMYSVTMWKDVLFGGSVLLFTICVIEIARDPGRFTHSRKYMALFALAALCVMFLRSNGFYVVLLSFPFIVLSMKGSRKKLAILFVAVLALNMAVAGPLFDALGVKKVATAALSVPIQQVARVSAYMGDKLTDEEREAVGRFFPAEDIAERYNPRLADPAIERFDEEFYEGNKMLFFETWSRLFSRFPKVYVESYLANSFGYWYPETVYWTVARDISDNHFGIERRSLFPESVREGIWDLGLFNKRDVPVLSMAYSIGFCALALFLAMCLVCVKGRHRYLAAFVPVLALLFTVSASPVYAEYRYVYGMVVCMPILASLALCVQGRDEGEGGAGAIPPGRRRSQK